MYILKPVNSRIYLNHNLFRYLHNYLKAKYCNQSFVDSYRSMCNGSQYFPSQLWKSFGLVRFIYLNHKVVFFSYFTHHCLKSFDFGINHFITGYGRLLSFL